MTLNFDFESEITVEFGVGRDNASEQGFVAVPVDKAVQEALKGMTETTWRGMREREDECVKYEPSDKHGTIEYLYLPLQDPMASTLRELHQASNLGIEPGALSEPSTVFCYFARLVDNNGRNITALRRASQFKGVVKSKGRLVQLYDDTLKIVADTVFKLDNDFDLLIDDSNLHILRPSGFEFAGKLKQAILAAVPDNIQSIRTELPFIEFEGIERYASQRPRAARCLASIQGQGEMKNIDQSALMQLCKNTGVDVSEAGGKVVIPDGHEMGFLEVLDRRRYELELVKGKPEKFRAASRKAIQ